MRIAIITTYFGKSIGGAEVSTKLLVDGLRNKNNMVNVISLKNFKLFNILPLGLKAFLLNTNLVDNYLMKEIKKNLSKIKPDIVHIQDLSVLAPSIRAAKNLGLKSIVTVRDTRFVCNLVECQLKGRLEFDCNSKKYLACLLKTSKQKLGLAFLGYLIYPFIKNRHLTLRKALNKTDKIISISNFIKKALVKLGTDSKKITTIYNPAPNWRYKPTKKHPGIILFAPGRLEEYKGFQVLIKALKSVKSNVRLIIAGTGSYKKHLKKLAKKLKLDGRITFTGGLSYDKIKEHYFDCDIVIFPSLWPEPLGRVPLEAMAAKKPVIASRVGGIPEIVDKKVGVLVKPGDSKEMAKAINSLVSSKTKFNFYKVKEFSIYSYVEKLLKQY